jgi:hypothetical protein
MEDKNMTIQTHHIENLSSYDSVRRTDLILTSASRLPQKNKTNPISRFSIENLSPRDRKLQNEPKVVIPAQAGTQFYETNPNLFT